MDNQVIYELLKEVKEKQEMMLDKSVEHREETLRWQAEADHRLSNIETDLREHKEGVIQNRKSLKIFDVRLQILEEPKKAREYIFKKTMKWLGIVGGIVTIASGVAKIFGLW